VQLVDRLARLAITVSGLTIIAAVLGIGLFLVLEILPLFSGAQAVMREAVQASPEGPAYAVVIDEHQERALVVGAEPAALIVPLAAGGQAEAVPLAELEGQRVTAASQILRELRVALGTDQGLVWIGALGFDTVFDGSQRRIQPVVEPGWIVQAAPGHAIRRLAWRPTAQGAILAVLLDEGRVIVTRVREQRRLIGEPTRSLSSFALPREGGTPAQLALDERGQHLVVGTTEGRLIRWRLDDADASPVESAQAVEGAVTALAYVLGDRSLAVGGQDGTVATWSPVRDERAPDGWRLTPIHRFPRHDAAITALAVSPRDKGLLSLSADGIGRLHYMTSERTLAQVAAGPDARLAAIAPKTNGAVILDGRGLLRHWDIRNPHPEVSWRALFGKIWYEGYERPEYIWQSTGGTDDFESKFSLIPLVYGTLKGTFYALHFAVPLALGGALYCSQFLDKRLRNLIKSTIELMAALPSVVLGFVAGVLLAPMVQGHIVAVLAAPPVIILTAVLGMLAMQALPSPALRGIMQRHEFWLLLAWILVGAALTAAAGPWIERALFGGDFEAWLLRATGDRYDQRNSMVVGWAMGFAVIPLIFTICEDAFSAVPKHLVGASLGCGASMWQTAWRVVLPAAGSGVFSAIMVGFGRAIGETMIVLMATGNTPVLDWSVFNGFRALSANIAVEIPEAPYGGTLYRVLFVAALLLFGMTFVVNTVAELIRLRLRAQLKGL
jgi:phosphate transport system permease protein